MNLRLNSNWTSHLNWKNFSILLLALFGALMFIIPVTNHYLLRTYAFDYGTYNFAFYDYAHLNVSDNPVYIVDSMSFMQDHLSFTFFFFIPLFWMLKWFFGTYTLLLIQSLFVILGGWASYKLIEEKTSSSFSGFLTLVIYFTIFGRYSSFAGDCNLMIILASFVPVFLLYFHRGKTWITILCFLFLILGRESIPLWMFFICIFLVIFYRKEREKAKLAAILGSVSVLYFIVAFKVFIPALEDPSRPFSLFTYSSLGKNPMEALTFIFNHPIDTFQLLFANTTGEAYAAHVKNEFFFVYLLSGGVLLFLRPYYLIPFIPIIAQKMFNDSPVRWGIASYYSVEISVLLPILIMLVLSSFKWKKIALFLGCVACIMSISITLHKLEYENREMNWIGVGKMNPFVTTFYESNLNISNIHHQIDKIPADASVAASITIVPHLAFRKHIYYLYRIPIKVDFILILKTDMPYLINEARYAKKIESWREDSKLRIYYEDKDLIIFKRNKK